jgi:hypothetical protein
MRLRMSRCRVEASRPTEVAENVNSSQAHGLHSGVLRSDAERQRNGLVVAVPNLLANSIPLKVVTRSV